MSAMTMVVCLVLLAMVRAVSLWRKLSRFERVRSSSRDGFTFELHRRALVCRAEADTQEFPQPREVRLLVLRLAGIPLWCRREEIGLPLHCDALLSQLRVEDFDAQFSGRFRALDATEDSVSHTPDLPQRA